MKNVKRIVAIVIYVVFAYVYSLMPKVKFAGGFEVMWNAFNLETFIMMLFVGIYLTAFWILINKLFRN